MLSTQYKSLHREPRSQLAMGGPGPFGAAVRNPAFLEWYEQLDRVTFHMCMHGGKRAKNTRLLASQGLYTALAGECDGQHEHEPWRITKVGTSLQYDTATEAEYPVLFCKRMANLLAESVQLQQPPCNATITRTSRRILGHHTKQAPPLVPEFSKILEMGAEPTQANHRCLASHLQGQTTEMEESTEQGHTVSPRQQDKKPRKMFRVGVQQEPQDFLKAAMELPHPMSPQGVLPATLKAALFDNLTDHGPDRASQKQAESSGDNQRDVQKLGEA